MELDKQLAELWLHHKWKIILAVCGLIFALMVIDFGFWWAVFICLCVAAGALVGRQIDKRVDIKSKLRDYWNRG
ncbi:MAG: DUF2273 domain-containing protein [Bacillota bacterium]|nr:DUF2273 domain-containing protein [Bacillota bacterium]